MAKNLRSPLYEELKHFVRRNGLLTHDSKVLVGVSGGIDSVVLLDLLSILAREWSFELVILHVNHQLRGAESLGDEKFVESLAERYRLQMYTARVETKKEAVQKKISIQEAARNLRYAFFLTKKKELHADVVATAHNANDNAETMLMNFFRGTGIDGIAGIPVSRGTGSVVRPLLFATRQEIAAYARAEKLKFREDSSNKSDKYSRNFLRRTVIPLLEKRINPSLVKTFLQSSTVFKDCAEYIERQVQSVYSLIVSEKNGEMLFRKDGLRAQHHYIRQMVVRSALLRRKIEPSVDRVSALLSLLDAGKGARVDCGDGWRGENGSDEILLSQQTGGDDFLYVLRKEGTVANGFFSLSVQKCKRIPNKLGIDTSIEYVDARKLGFPLHVRSWKEGDAFIPLGMKHRKKVSDLFVDLKISRTEKAKIPIVECSGNIVWVAGCRLDDRCKITSTTTEAYKLSFTNP